MHIGGIWRRGEGEKGFSHIEIYASERVQLIKGDDFSVYLDGELFDEIPSTQSPESVLENGYGCYCYVCVEEKERSYIVGTDRLGFSALYYHYSCDGSELTFSSNLNWLKDRIGKVTVNTESLDELLNLGEILGNKTIGNEISRLGYGEKIVLNQSGARFIRFWRPELPEYTDEGTYISCNNRLLEEAIERTKGKTSRKVLLLSGGEDSRRITAAAVRTGLQFSLATQKAVHSGNVDDDLALAKEIAQRLKMEIHVEEMASKETYLRDCDFSDYALGFETIQMGWLIPVLRYIPEGSLIYDGIVGDINVNASCLKRHPGCIDKYRDNAAMADLIVKGRRLFPVAGVTTSLKERIISQLEEMPHSPYKISYYYMLNHSRRSVALGAQLFKLFGCEVCYPFLYYPLFLQSLSLPPDKQLLRHYQKVCTAAHCPELADLPSTRGIVPTEYLTDVSCEVRSRSMYFARHHAIKGATVRKYLAEYTTRLLFYHISGRLNLQKLIQRLDWIGKPLHFTSNLVEWADNNLRVTDTSLGDKKSKQLRLIIRY